MPHRPSLLVLLMRWELVRLARRKQVIRNRILFLYLLLLTLALFTLWWSSPGSPLLLLRSLFDSLSLKNGGVEKQGFAESFVLVLLESQLLFVSLFAPAYAASAVSEEKDKRTLALLLTTELTDREIVWGKAIARTLLILFAVAVAIPLLVLCWLFGAVSFELIVVGYALTVGTAILSASIGMNAACRCPDTRTALVRAYSFESVLVFGLPFFMPLSSFAVLAYEFGLEGPFRLKIDSSLLRLGVGCGYAMLQTVIGLAILVPAARNLRQREPTAGTVAPTAYPEPPRGRPTPVVLGTRSARPLPLPPLDARSPVLWLERHVARRKILPILDTPALGGILTFIAAILFVVGAWQLLNRAVVGFDPDAADLFNQQAGHRVVRGGWLLAAGVLMAALYLVPLIAGVAASVAGERQRQTLDSLLMTSIPRHSILWAKARAHLERWLGFGVASVAAIGCDFGAVGGVPCGFAVMAAVAAGFWFAIAYDAWLSVHCATSGRAFRLCLPPLLGVIAIPLLAWGLIDWSQATPAITALYWLAAILILLGCIAWWRAVVDLNRGE
jgi:ABC-type transport system involved in multi-copper enzyme maturation permease subunit